MPKFIKNPRDNKAWKQLRKDGYNPRDWMYMYSDSPLVHLFKNIITRQYIKVSVLEEVVDY